MARVGSTEPADDQNAPFVGTNSPLPSQVAKTSNNSKYRYLASDDSHGFTMTLSRFLGQLYVKERLQERTRSCNFKPIYLAAEVPAVPHRVRIVEQIAEPGQREAWLHQRQMPE